MMRIPRLLVAGTHSGAGKTTVAIGLLLALRRAGLRVQPFKAGPDYIDPGHLTQAGRRPCRNLDRWLIPPGRLLSLFAQGCQGADAALIEGVMGFYDGVSATDEKGSTAELAKQLRCPVLLVLDAAGLSRSAAAIVQGFVRFDREVQWAGCFLNRVGGPGHFRLLKEGIERLTGLAVVGYLARDDQLRLPERHLGLVPVGEGGDGRRFHERLGRRIREGVDLAALQRLMRSAPELEGGGWKADFGFQSTLRPPQVVGGRPPTGCGGHNPPSTISIGVAMDSAFHFYYRENLELLEAAGARLLPFSPLSDPDLPKGIAALYLGGGFPEIFAEALSGNRRLRRRILQVVEAGMPTYAECGGLMYLTRRIRDSRGRGYPMVGLIPAEVDMTDRLQNFGYQTVCARQGTWMARSGERARGHEFHHSRLRRFSSRHAAYEATAAGDGRGRLEGYAKGPLLASYVHVHFWSNLRWAGRFVQAARNWEEGRAT